jgi:hypothetical protein
MDFDQEGTDRNIAGMVGTGALQHVMIITKWQLRQGFINNNDAHNTAIHEFAHLIDKMDGTMDGVPEIILEKKYVPQWKQMMETTIEQMKNYGSDIDMYGATNTVEFFAVITEYFFEQPDSLKANHPGYMKYLKGYIKLRDDNFILLIDLNYNNPYLLTSAYIGKRFCNFFKRVGSVYQWAEAVSSINLLIKPRLPLRSFGALNKTLFPPSKTCNRYKKYILKPI